MDIPSTGRKHSKRNSKQEEISCPFCGEKNNEICYNLDCITIHAKNVAIRMALLNKSKKWHFTVKDA